jgi:hypothetical protein
MRKCPACGVQFRSGTLAFMLEPGEGKRGLRGVVVCGACAKGGVLLVAPKLAPVKVEKVAKPEGYDRVLRMLRTYARAAKGTASQCYAKAARGAAGEEASDHSHFNGKADGIEVAI